MTEELPSAGTGAPAAPPPAATDTSGMRPSRRRLLLFGLGALTGVAWLGAVLLDPSVQDLGVPVAHLVPVGLPSGLHVVLVLAVPMLILLLLRPPLRQPARRRARAVAFVVVEAFFLVLAALPALLPYSTLGGLLSLPLRLPTPSLGVALAAMDPLVGTRGQERAPRAHDREQGEQREERMDPDDSMVLVAGVGFSAVLVVTAVVVLGLIALAAPCTGAAVTIHPCGGVLALVITVLCADTFICVVLGVFGAWLGFALGSLIVRLDRQARA